MPRPTLRARVLDVTLDPLSPIPLYIQLKHHIVHLISSGAWPPGLALPSVRNLASELGLATATVQRACGELQREGVLVSQVGRGVYVAELAAGYGDTRAQRATLLNGIFARSLAHARSVGFSNDQILESMRALLRGNGDGEPGVHVVFVGAGPEFADKYRSLLAEALADIPVTVTAITVDDLERDADAALDELEPIVCLVSLVGTFAEVRRLTGARKTPLFGLVVDLTQDSQSALIDLADDIPIALVAEDHYMQSARGLVRQYRGSEDGLAVVTHSNRGRLARVIRDARVIVHTFGSKKLLEGRVPPDTSLVELRYVPNPASIARLRNMLMGVLGQQQIARNDLALSRD
jgi:GntR family transcriptional regulator